MNQKEFKNKLKEIKEEPCQHKQGLHSVDGEKWYCKFCYERVDLNVFYESKEKK